VELDTDNENVEFIPTNEDIIKLSLSGKGTTFTKQILSSTVNGTALSINLQSQSHKFFSFDFLSTALNLKVYLPKKEYNLIQINNDNGFVQGEQINTKHLKAKTNNGRIELKNIPSETVNAECDNGKISLDHVDGKMIGTTNNGKISVVTKNLDRPIQLNCDNGSILIRTETEPTNVSFNVNVDNGHVNILNKYSGNAVIGKGDNLVKLTTNNGQITVAK
jgi:DUF4097 and DUF4098 domain-containing protein YvlB